MPDRNETVALADGSMDVFITRPEGDGPFPEVVQLMDGLGMRDELHGHARRVASWGYCVVSPDLFYRQGLKGPLNFGDPDSRDKIMAAIGRLTAQMAKADVEAALALVEGDPAVQGGKIGLHGYCMGGKLTLELAQAMGDKVACGASIHPGGLSTDAPNSPHRHLDQVSAELYFGIADQDAMATPEQMADLEKALEAAGVTYQLEWHPGALHGFMMPSRAELYNEQAAETVWKRMEDLFARCLK
ncbi:MAG: dienelactone hydrolase family protein [Novosphingobium sp.]|nr:dienelactone hydrolase family protein [Novosphingobium sp.]